MTNIETLLENADSVIDLLLRGDQVGDQVRKIRDRIDRLKVLNNAKETTGQLVVHIRSLGSSGIMTIDSETLQILIDMEDTNMQKEIAELETMLAGDETDTPVDGETTEPTDPIDPTVPTDPEDTDLGGNTDGGN